MVTDWAGRIELGGDDIWRRSSGSGLNSIVCVCVRACRGTIADVPEDLELSRAVNASHRMTQSSAYPETVESYQCPV